MSPGISPRIGRRQRNRPLNSTLTSGITDIQGPASRTVEAMATNSSGPLVKSASGDVSSLYAVSSSSKTNTSEKETLYADGREIPFPDINFFLKLVDTGYCSEGHPAHIPTGTAGFEVLTFYPTYDEFKDFNAYITKIEAVGAHFKSGICKIVAPDGWCPRPSKKKYDYKDELVEGFRIKSPVEERIEGKNFVYTKSSRVFRKEITASNFRKLTLDPKYKNPHPELRGKDIEVEFFKNIMFRTPVYGADTEGTLYDNDVDEFNMSRLGTILDETKGDGGKIIKGVNSVYMYFGMYGSTFAWHCEDMELYSINYLHYGAPKYWFAIPPEAAPRFERFMSHHFTVQQRNCKAFLRHKNYLVHTKLLEANNIPYGTMIQYPNEFIITFPHGYHMGFNLGFNIAESTNFATNRWIDFGKNAVLCKCRSDMVEIDMTPFMKKYRPDEFDYWYSYWYLPKLNARVAPNIRGKGRKLSSCHTSSGFVDKKTKIQAGGELVSRTGQTKNSGEVEGGADSTSIDECNETMPFNPKEVQSRPVTVRGQRWRNNLAHLWSNGPVNLFAEREYNKRIALYWPHCAICQYFHPLHMSDSISELPERSSRLVSSLCFTKDHSRISSIDLTEDILLTCINCGVSVHPCCYGGENYSNRAIDGWCCLRCRGRNDVAIRSTSCHLCELRGGALIPCQAGGDNRAYAHTVCAIFNRRTVFNAALGPSSCYTHPPPKQAPQNNILSRLPAAYVIAMGDEQESARFQCDLCSNSREGLVRCTACDEDSEPVLAHATCARQAGFLFEKRAYPQITAMICDKHNFETGQELAPLHRNDIVIAWLDGGERVEQGRIEKLTAHTYLTIDFIDGTISDNTLPSDVVSCCCIKCFNGHHQAGSRVRVRWDDDELYDGYYRRTSEAIEYTVRFADGTYVRMDRSDLYGASDVVPAEVRRRLKGRR